MNSIQKAQQRGSFPTDEYEIIDITSQNIISITKLPYLVVMSTQRSTSARPTQTPSAHTISSLLQVVDAGSESGIPSQDKLPAQFGPIEVPQTGRISHSLCGEFNVLGKEIADVQNEIQEAYHTVFNYRTCFPQPQSRASSHSERHRHCQRPRPTNHRPQGRHLADLVAKSRGTSQEPFTCEYILHRGKQSYKLNNKEITTKNLLARILTSLKSERARIARSPY